MFGKTPHLEPSADRWEDLVIRSLSGDDKLSSYSYETIGSGLAAVWARENTREGLFDAMQKKEAYATTGTRIVVRFFGGWDYQRDEVFKPDAATIGYDRGVPMGGDLPARGAATAPVFMVGALKDPWSGNLDRIQIVKGWVDKRGRTFEQVYDVVWSGDRQPGADGKLAPVGNTVDVSRATYFNTIGASELITVWEDPDFDPELRAFYYARVIEIPTPRWTTYEAVRFEVDLPEQAARSIQERAYTSPIWYTP